MRTPGGARTTSCNRRERHRAPRGEPRYAVCRARASNRRQMCAFAASSLTRCQTVTPDEWMNLIYETRAAVFEQAFLFEVLLGSTEVRNGQVVRHGPCDPDACSMVLTIWFDLGWVGGYMPSEQVRRWGKQPATWMSRLATSHHPMLGNRRPVSCSRRHRHGQKTAQRCGISAADPHGSKCADDDLR